MNHIEFSLRNFSISIVPGNIAVFYVFCAQQQWTLICIRMGTMSTIF